MVHIKVQPGESPDSAYKKFTRKVIAEGIFQELEEKRRYIKPSRRRYEAKKLAMKRVVRYK